MSRFSNLTKEEIEVLFEYVEFAKREVKFLHPILAKAMMFDHIHGEFEALELLNDCFYDLIKAENLGRDEIVELARLLSERERTLDVDPLDIFHPENDVLNEILERNRKNKKTNGLEFL